MRSLRRKTAADRCQTLTDACDDQAMTDTPTPGTGVAGDPPALDIQRQERCRHVAAVSSRVWFTLSHGILNEVYYPRLDQACLRDLGLIVTDGREFVSEEKRDAVSRLEWLAPGVPAFRLVNTCREGRYRDREGNPRRPAA